MLTAGDAVVLQGRALEEDLALERHTKDIVVRGHLARLHDLQHISRRITDFDDETSTRKNIPPPSSPQRFCSASR